MLDNKVLYHRTLRMGYRPTVRVALACGFDGTLLREGVIDSVADNGMLMLTMDDGEEGGSRYQNFERATILTPEDEASDAAIDRWHHGREIHRRGGARPYNPEMAAGWDDRESERGVEVVMPARPEGYYHQSLGTLD